MIIKVKSRMLFSKDIRGNIRYWQLAILYDEKSIELRTSYGLYGKGAGSTQTTRFNIEKFKKVETIYNRRVNQHLNGGYRTDESLGVDKLLTFEDKADVASSIILSLESQLTVDKVDINNIRKPMKAKAFTHGSMTYPALIQPKLNGYRGVMMEEPITTGEGMFELQDIDVTIKSKEGHEYVLPHITSKAAKYKELFSNDLAYDGEIYCHGKLISELKRCIPFRKSNSNNVSHPSDDPLLTSYVIFDLPIPDVSQTDRDAMLGEIAGDYGIPILSLDDLGSIHNYEIYILETQTVYSDDDVVKYRDKCISLGFEGCVVRDMNSEYHFGGRHKTMMKAKKYKLSEFIIEDIVLVNKDDRRTYINFILRNDTNNLTFESNPEGNESIRQDYLNNKESYIGKTATVKYYERTVKGLPFHSNVTQVAREDIGDLSDDALDI